MAGKTRKTLLSLKKETTEGVLVFPASSADYVALQEGFSMAPAFEELTSAELTGSIGQSRSVLGFENPEASFDHYFRGSGVEGTEPNFSELVESALGEMVPATTERTAQASSTATLVKLAGGFGAEYQRGKALLIKKASTYEVRNVLSVATDDLSLAQAITNTTGLVGSALGRSILFKPTDDNHPSLSAIVYSGNGTAVQAMSAAKVTEMTIEVEAGQYVNASYSMSGIKYFFNPTLITASTDTIDWTDDAGTWAVALDAKSYRDPHELASALQIAMNATSSEDFVVSYSDSTGKYTISTATSVLFEILFSTGANTAQTLATKFGFTVADKTGAVTYTSENAISLVAPHTPSYDNAQPLVAKANEVMLGDQDDISCFGAQTLTMTISNEKTDISDLCEESGRSGSIISSREVTVDIVSLLSEYDSDKFRRFRSGESIQFTYNFGEKEGGSWVPGKTCNFFIPTATITNFEITDTDGLVTLEMSLRAFVDDGQGEVFINFL